MSKKKSKIRKWFRKKYQLILYHSKSYDIVWKLKFSRILFIAVVFVSIVFLFTASYAIIAYTPIKKTIPDFPTEETKILIYENAIKVDSLAGEIEKRDSYLKMLQDLIYNEIPIDQDFVVPTQHLTEKFIKEFNNPTLPRKKIENDNIEQTVSKSEVMPSFFPPLKGYIVSSFDKSKGHFGTDIASSGETTISASLGGTVIFADYSVKNGYTIIIQHKQNIITVYKHNKSVLVTTGQYVEIGQAIAIYGNTGEYTSGQHLHFELWKKGVPLNPQDYINFE